MSVSAFVISVGSYVLADDGFLNPCDSALVKDALARHLASACWEFWLNRYQTTIVGLVGVAAALIAAFFVWRQLREARRQTAIALGDLSPDFILREDDKYFSCAVFELLVVNQNRRPIEIRYMKVISHKNIVVSILPGPGVRPFGYDRLRRLLIKCAIPGTWPGGPAPNQITISGTFSDIVKTPKDHVVKADNVVIEIGYEILDQTVTQFKVRRILPSVKIASYTFAVKADQGAIVWQHAIDETSRLERASRSSLRLSKDGDDAATGAAQKSQ
jgi:hypothetical protein